MGGGAGERGSLAEVVSGKIKTKQHTDFVTAAVGAVAAADTADSIRRNRFVAQ